jgi:hypothetical protein
VEQHISYRYCLWLGNTPYTSLDASGPWYFFGQPSVMRASKLKRVPIGNQWVTAVENRELKNLQLSVGTKLNDGLRQAPIKLVTLPDNIFLNVHLYSRHGLFGQKFRTGIRTSLLGGQETDNFQWP